jgi:uncharacterized protein involved in propanediol utilization
VQPAWKTKARAAAQAALRALGVRHIAGKLTISSNIPPCRGLGSSTSDCISAIRAVANAFSISLPGAEIARLAREAESASDATMFEEEWLAFRQMEGVVHERFNRSPSQMRLLVVDTPARGSGVRTDLVRRPCYSISQMDCFNQLLARLKRAVRDNAQHAIGDVATRCAQIHQQYDRKPHFDVMLRLAETTRALGVATAHSGTVLVLLYRDDATGQEGLHEANRHLSERGFLDLLVLKSA